MIAGIIQAILDWILSKLLAFGFKVKQQADADKAIESEEHQAAEKAKDAKTEEERIAAARDQFNRL